MPDETGTAVLDAPVTTATEPSGEALSQESTSEIEPRKSTPTKTPEQEKLDRRNNTDAMRKALKWMRENGQEHSAQAQEIERALGELKSWKTVAPNVREARELRATIEAVGGREKLAEMQQYTTRMREVDSLIAAGDERALPMILESPEMISGVAKLLPGIMRELAKTHGGEISSAIRPHVAGFLESEGLTDAIDEMVQHFNANEPAKARETLAKIVNWYKAKLANGSTEAKPAEQQAWEKERETFQQERFAGDVGRVFDESMGHAETQIKSELAPSIKKYGIPSETAQLIVGDVWKRIEKERNADPLFEAGIADRVNERTRKVDPGTAKFLKDQVDQRVKEATRKEIQLRYGFIDKTKPPGEKKENITAPPATGVSVGIDYQKTFAKYGGEDSGRNAIIAGKAVNAAGKDIKKVNGKWMLA